MWRGTYVTFPAYHLFAIILAGQSLERRLDDATTETEHEMEGGFLKPANPEYVSAISFF